MSTYIASTLIAVNTFTRLNRGPWLMRSPAVVWTRSKRFSTSPHVCGVGARPTTATFLRRSWGFLREVSDRGVSRQRRMIGNRLRPDDDVALPDISVGRWGTVPRRTVTGAASYRTRPWGPRLLTALGALMRVLAIRSQRSRAAGDIDLGSRQTARTISIELRCRAKRSR